MVKSKKSSKSLHPIVHNGWRVYFFRCFWQRCFHSYSNWCSRKRLFIWWVLTNYKRNEINDTQIFPKSYRVVSFISKIKIQLRSSHLLDMSCVGLTLISLVIPVALSVTGFIPVMLVMISLGGGGGAILFAVFLAFWATACGRWLSGDEARLTKMPIAFSPPTSRNRNLNSSQPWHNVVIALQLRTMTSHTSW